MQTTHLIECNGVTATKYRAPLRRISCDASALDTHIDCIAQQKTSHESTINATLHRVAVLTTAIVIIAQLNTQRSRGRRARVFRQRCVARVHCSLFQYDTHLLEYMYRCWFIRHICAVGRDVLH